MTHYNLYIQAGLELDSQTRFYKVAIGEGQLGRKQYAWLEAYAIEHGHFFVRWSSGAIQFVMDCRESIGYDAAPVISITGRDLIKSLKNGCEDPAIWQAIQHRHQLMMRINPHYYTYHELSKR